jgi:hypothetical protein
MTTNVKNPSSTQPPFIPRVSSTLLMQVHIPLRASHTIDRHTSWVRHATLYLSLSLLSLEHSGASNAPQHFAEGCERLKVKATKSGM